MEIAIVECVNYSNSKDAHVRQAKFIKNFFIKNGHKCEILYRNTINNYVNKKYDIIIKSYSTFYENYEEEIKLYANNKENAKFYFITNEYTIQSGGVIGRLLTRGYNISIIANFDIDKITNKNWKEKYFVNFNALFFNKKEKQNKKYKICYYGTYRKDRKKYFKKYFVSKDIIVSTSPKSIKKFVKEGCIFTPCKRFVWGKNKDTLGLFQYSLYIEDEWIHNNFHNLADRFYEALSNETVILFDKSCENTLKKSELKNENYSQFIIDSLDDIKNRDYKKDLEIQKKWINIIEIEQEKVYKKLKEIFI